MTVRTKEAKRRVLKPFVVAHAEDATRPSRSSAQHLSKDKATREVLKRLVKRVKAI